MIITLWSMFLLFELGIIIYFLIDDYYSPRFSPMGPWPSKHEEHLQKIRDSKASYKEEYLGVVPVKTYRWSGEKEARCKTGFPTIITGYKTVRYRKEWDSLDWKLWEENIDTKNFKGIWMRI